MYFSSLFKLHFNSNGEFTLNCQYFNEIEASNEIFVGQIWNEIRKALKDGKWLKL